MDFEGKKIGFIGSGMMGGALMQAIAKKFGGENILLSDVDFSKASSFAEKIGAKAVKTNAELAKNSDVLFLAVKPAYISDVLKEISSSTKNFPLIVSIAAGVKIESIRHSLYEAKCPVLPLVRIIRVMPNLPATVGEAMIALSPEDSCGETDVAFVKELLESAGKVEVVAEKLMDAVTAVSGSGPAYAFLFIEALADAAVRFGIPRNQAYVYAAQTLRGSATLFLEDGRSVSALKDAVCSPAGTTIEGVVALERCGFRNAVIEAATAAYEKSVELGKK